MIGASIIKLRTFSVIPGRRIAAATEGQQPAAAAAVGVVRTSPAIDVRGLLSFFYSNQQRHACSYPRTWLYDGRLRNKLSPFPTIEKFFSTSNGHQVTAGKVFDDLPQRALNSRSTNFDRVLGLLRDSNVRGDPAFPQTSQCLALKIGADSHLPVLTSLIMAYSRAGELPCSHKVFGEISCKDVIVYNAMITSLVGNGCFKEGLELLSALLSCQIGFSSTSLLLIVSALICSGGLVQGRALHGLALTSGSLLDPLLCNALIDMYAKFGDLVSAELVFQKMGSRRDSVSWNSMLSGFLHGNDPQRCLLCFLGRVRGGEKGDSISLSCAISAASSLRKLRWGQVLHALSSKIGLDNNPYCNSVANSLICLYSACGESEAAETIFRGMVVKDTVSWNALIEGLRLNGEIEGALDLLNEMRFIAQNRPDKMTLLTVTSICADEMLLAEGRAIHGFILRGGMESDSSLINSLIYMYAKCVRVDSAHFLFECMIPRRDSVSWNTMISARTESGQNATAQSLFREMLKGSIECSAATLLAVLPSCDSPEFLVFGKLIHSWILKSGLSSNNHVVNSAISMYINCGELKAAFSLFQRDSDREDVTSWNTIIGGYVQSGYSREALDAFRFMMREGNVAFGFITLLSVLTACGNLALVCGGEVIHGLAVKALLGSETRVQNALMTMYGRCGEVESARSVFMMGHNLNLCSWNCMISIFCQNKNPIEALNLFSHLNLEPDEFTITGIITACAQLGSIRNGQQIHAHVFRLRLHKNPAICSALMDTYSNCGRLDLASQVFRLLPDKSVESYLRIVIEPKLPSAFLQVICWVLGEYGTADGNYSASYITGKLCDVAEAYSSDETIKAYAITALMKIYAFEIAAGRKLVMLSECQSLIEELAASHSTDLQQRAYELQAVISLDARTIESIMPADASCEDIEIDITLPFLNKYVQQSLENGAQPYIPEEQRSGTLGISSFSNQEHRENVVHGLKFEAYEMPKPLVPSHPPPPVSHISNELVPVPEPSYSRETHFSSSVPSVSSSGPAELKLRLDGVQKKWGKPSYSSTPSSSSGVSHSPANGASQVEPSAVSTSRPRDSYRDSKKAEVEITPEKQKLAASLFGGSSKPEKRAASTAHRASKGSSHSTEKSSGLKPSVAPTIETRTPPQPLPDLLDFGDSTASLIPPSVDPFTQLEGLLDLNGSASSGSNAPVDSSSSFPEVVPLYSELHVGGQSSSTPLNPLSSNGSNNDNLKRTVSGGSAQGVKGPNLKEALEKDALVRQMGVNPTTRNPNLFKDLFG